MSATGHHASARAGSRGVHHVTAGEDEICVLQLAQRGGYSSGPASVIAVSRSKSKERSIQLAADATSRVRVAAARAAKHGVSQRVRIAVDRTARRAGGVRALLDGGAYSSTRSGMPSLRRRSPLPPGRRCRPRTARPRSRTGPSQARQPDFLGEPRAQQAGPQLTHGEAENAAPRGGSLRRPAPAWPRGRPGDRAHRGPARRPSADPPGRSAARRQGLRYSRSARSGPAGGAAVRITGVGGDRRTCDVRLPPRALRAWPARGHAVAGQVQQQTSERLDVAGERAAPATAKPLREPPRDHA